MELARFLANFENIQVGLGDLEAQLRPETSKESDVHRVTKQINDLLESLPMLVITPPRHSLLFRSPASMDRFIGPGVSDDGRTIRYGYGQWTGAVQHKKGRVTWTLKMMINSTGLQVGVLEAVDGFKSAITWGSFFFSHDGAMILTIDFRTNTVAFNEHKRHQGNSHYEYSKPCKANMAYTLYVVCEGPSSHVEITLLNTQSW